MDPFVGMNSSDRMEADFQSSSPGVFIRSNGSSFDRMTSVCVVFVVSLPRSVLPMSPMVLDLDVGPEKVTMDDLSDMMKVNNIQYESYKDACYALGIIEDDKEYIDGIKEASYWASAQSLQRMLCTLLNDNCMQNPSNVWEQCWAALSDDILYSRRKRLNCLTLSDEELKNFALIETELILRRYGGSLQHIDSMLYHKFDSSTVSENRLILEELQYDVAKLEEELEVLISKLIDEQHQVFEVVLDSVNCNKGKTFFLYGFDGTGKTFVWKVLSAELRCKQYIVLNVASSGIASLLLPGGRTAHSRFKIPLTPVETSTCNIKLGTNLAELIVQEKLIIWDEAPMMRKYCFEALDRTLRDIMKSTDVSNVNKPFGGKTIVFGGDFRQILPVIPKGCRHDIVSATKYRSYIWKDCELSKFGEWIASIGDGTIGDGENGVFKVKILNHMLIENDGDPIASIVDTIYPELDDASTDPTYLKERAILAPTLSLVDSVNHYMIEKMSGECRTYYSSNSACRSDSCSDILADVHTPEFLNSIKCSGVGLGKYAEIPGLSNRKNAENTENSVYRKIRYGTVRYGYRHCRYRYRNLRKI
ncbi:hypothetical protein CASFOL_037141 [Castilleja foliolosa]|uniref:ATP-dependent DNA helicase n=1 Tax=Castilleja foliolosa TaxID=1961234 RepID=A0ABD3BN34_9LAMI